jgi:WD40 repeat protein
VCEIASRRFLARLPIQRASFGKLHFAPDGRWLAISQRGQVLLWNWKSGQRRDLPLPSATVGATALAWSSDGRYLASGCNAPDAPVFVWDFSDGAELASLPELPAAFQLAGHRHLVQSLAFSPDGKTLASAGTDQTVRVWELENRRERRCLRGHLHELRAVAFSPDGKQLVSCGLDGTVRVWDPLEHPHEAPFTVLPIRVPYGSGCAFAPDGRSFIALDWSNGSASLWDTATLQEREKLDFLGTNLAAVAWARDGRALALSDMGGNVRIWDLSTRRSVTNFVPRGGIAGVLRFSGQHGPRRLLALRNPWDPPHARLWDVSDWREIALPAEALNGLKGAAVSPDARTMVVTSAGGRVSWWDLSSGQCLGRFEDQFARAEAFVRFSPDGRMVAISETKGVITLWDAALQKRTASIDGNLRTVNGLAFTPDGRRLLTSGADDEDAVRLLDLGSQRYVAGLPAPVDTYTSVTMSPDETTLVAVGSRGTAVFWRAPSWEEIARRENQQTGAK